MANYENIGNPKKIKPIKEFSLKASTHRTPSKNSKIELVPSDCEAETTESSRKSMIESYKLEKGKFGKNSLEMLSKMENQIITLGSELKGLANAVTSSNSDSFH